MLVIGRTLEGRRKERPENFSSILSALGWIFGRDCVSPTVPLSFKVHPSWAEFLEVAIILGFLYCTASALQAPHVSPDLDMMDGDFWDCWISGLPPHYPLWNFKSSNTFQLFPSAKIFLLAGTCLIHTKRPVNWYRERKVRENKTLRALKQTLDLLFFPCIWP